MGNTWVIASCGMQLWLINHSNCITNLFLYILYAIDVIAYTIFSPQIFLSRRSKLFGPNYASLGRIIVGEYEKCAELIESPQKRSNYLGRAKINPRRFPKNFILFLSDTEAGGEDTHAILHQHFWKTFVPPAFGRLSEPAFDSYVNEAVSAINAEGGVDKMPASRLTQILQHMTAKYVFHSLFGVVLTGTQLKQVDTFFYGKSPLSTFVFGGVVPFSTPFGCFQCSRNSLFSSLTKMVMNSPVLKDYVPTDATANLSKQNYAEVILSIAGVAGCLGPTNLCLQVLTGIPEGYFIDLENKIEVTLAVLEAARLKSPVNNVNSMLQNELTLTINGKEYTFPQGTVVSACIGLSSLDPGQFKDPHKFNSKRENLMQATLTFNHVGFNAVGAGKRQCPGRNIAVKLASDLLIQYRGKYFVDE
jgi:hypothetical protein